MRSFLNRLFGKSISFDLPVVTAQVVVKPKSIVVKVKPKPLIFKPIEKKNSKILDICVLEFPMDMPHEEVVKNAKDLDYRLEHMRILKQDCKYWTNKREDIFNVR